MSQTVEVDTVSGNRADRVVRNELTIGLDLFKNIPYMVFANRLPIDQGSVFLTNRGIAEVMLRRQKRERFYQTALLGYSQMDILSPKSIERQQNAAGIYAKLGNEWTLGQRNGHSKLGIRGIVTYCRYKTDLVYPGPTFGDYRSTDVVHNAGFGFDPYYAYDFFLGQRWLLRWETRWPLHYRIIGKGYTPYYPGVGASLGLYSYITSLGTTLQLHYIFRHKAAGR